MSRVAGKVVLVSFIFTTCNGSCPATTARMHTVAGELKREGLLKDDRVWLLSVTLDPKRDDAAALRRYRRLYDIEGAHWDFLTGPVATVEKAYTAWGMWALMQHPEQYAALREDPDARMKPAVEEVLRWASPVYHFRRTATRATRLGDRELAEGDKVVMWYISANRDEAVFDDPFCFDSARTPNEHLAFGFGTHFCLGASLARLEISVMLDELLARLPDLRLADPDAAPEYRPANFVSGLETLPVLF